MRVSAQQTEGSIAATVSIGPATVHVYTGAAFESEKICSPKIMVDKREKEKWTKIELPFVMLIQRQPVK